MRRIIVVENVTLDGVIQAPGDPDEDRRGGFEYGGWAAPYNDPVMLEEMGKDMGRTDLLFGRWTYQKMYAAWHGNPEPNPFTEVLDHAHKYVVSTTLTEPLEWVNSTLLECDAAVKQEMVDAGVWVFAGGLHDPSASTVLQLKGDEVVTTDGPYAEGKEHLGGFCLIKVPDLDAALEWGRKYARASTLPIEVRPFRGEA